MIDVDALRDCLRAEPLALEADQVEHLASLLQEQIGHFEIANVGGAEGLSLATVLSEWLVAWRARHPERWATLVDVAKQRAVAAGAIEVPPMVVAKLNLGGFTIGHRATVGTLQALLGRLLLETSEEPRARTFQAESVFALLVLLRERSAVHGPGLDQGIAEVAARRRLPPWSVRTLAETAIRNLGGYLDKNPAVQGWYWSLWR